MTIITETRIMPSFAKVTFTDYWCMLLALAPALLVALACGLVVTGHMDLSAAISRLSIANMADLGRDDVLIVISLLLIVVCPPLLMKRVSVIRRVFASGLQADGEIVSLREFRDRGRIEFEFEHEDEIIHAANAVHLTRAVRSMHVGRHVTVYYSPEKPRRAFVAEIFLG